MRSFSGCLTCRHRKVKCDEARPDCGPCTKSSRKCEYVERTVFRNFEGYTPSKRKQHGKTRPSSKPVLREEQTWLDVPRKLTFVNVEDPFHIPQSPEDLHETHAVGGAEEDKIGLNEPIDEATSHILSQTPSSGPHHGDTESSPLTSVEPSPRPDIGTEAKIDPNILALHLLRRFKEGPGLWMDLFDTGAYFSSKLPVMAATRPLLKSAACALAAKHLYRLGVSWNDTKQFALRALRKSHFPSQLGDIDWRYQSARFYGQALDHLNTTIDSHPFEDDSTNREEIFAAVAVLCTYELMDAPGTAWKAHLSALPLFTPRAEVASTASPVVIPRTAISGPIFWSLARQDLLCSFISETLTRLDLKNMKLWQHAGLATDGQGLLFSFEPPSFANPRISADIEEDTKSNELTWILGKIANYIVSGDALVPEDFSLPPGQRPTLGIAQELILERWTELMNELQQWFRSLPSTFRACSRTKASHSVGTHDDLVLDGFEQSWYDLPLCAATMQSYHQANIILLVNRPQESTAIRSTISARLCSYRQIQEQATYHAKQICSISLANPTDPVRINSVHALFVAGQVFHKREEQNVVLHLLSDIEHDLGWTTSYYIQRLVDEWANIENNDPD
ncbi:hypothetical protein F4782DRAFT_164892 [Xylaria castorea]|nr:hypothetical protein F4782DRAFT_164892 [Xylaria castorea]